MKIRNIFYGIVRPFVSPIAKLPTYIGVKRIAESAKAFGSMIKPLLVPPKAVPKEEQETFEQALTRLNLTEADIERRKKEFTRLLITYLLIALGLFCYTFYLVWQRSIHGSLATFAIMLIALAQAFRYHFWLFQIKHRKLGCTVRDWWNSDFIGENK